MGWIHRRNQMLGRRKQPQVRTPDSRDRFVTYVDKAGKHRWRLYDENGLIIGASTQGYANPDGMVANLERVAGSTQVVVEE